MIMQGIPAGWTGTYVNRELVQAEEDNSSVAEKAVKEWVLATYGPVRLVERVISGRGRVRVFYVTV